MNAQLIQFVVGSVICSAAVWALYALLLRRQTSHRASRIFLLASLIVPLLLPTVQLMLPAGEERVLLRYTLPEQLVGQGKDAQVTAFEWQPVLFALYLTIALFLMLRQVAGAFRFLRKLRRFPSVRHNGFHVHHDSGAGPGSIGNHIFFPGAEIQPDVLAHEIGHIRLRHRFDLALANFLCCACWVNPFYRVLRSELRLVHEFEADSYATSGCTDAEAYARLLLQQRFGIPTAAFSHSFFHHPIKLRITMLFRTEISRSRRITRMIAAGLSTSLICGALLFVQCRQEIPGPQPAASGAILKKADQMPKFKGDLSGYLGKTLTYPRMAILSGTEGRSIIQFVITQEGTVAQAEVVRSSGSVLLDEEALRVIRQMPAWTPGRDNGVPVSVFYTIPVTFRLDDDSDKSDDNLPATSGTFEVEELSMKEYFTFRSESLKTRMPDKM